MKTLTANQLALYRGCEAETVWHNKVYNTYKTQVSIINGTMCDMSAQYISIKPYLRPVASITEEEARHIAALTKVLSDKTLVTHRKDMLVIWNINDDDRYRSTVASVHICFDPIELYFWRENNIETPEYNEFIDIDGYLRSRFIDTRNWIEQGLAIDKTKI